MRVDINRGFFVNFFLLLGTLAVLCAITEITSRLAFPEWRYIWSQGFLQHDRVLGTYVGKAGYRSRLYSIYGEFDVPVALNHGGFRNPEGASPEKAGIYCFGDSFGFGWGVKANEVMCAVSAIRMKIPYFNFSMPATDLTDYFLLIRKNVNFFPGRNVVVMVTYENDVLSYPEPTAVKTGRLQPAANRVYKWLIENSAFWSLASSVLQRSASFVSLVRKLGFLAPSGASTGGERDPIAASIEMLDTMRQMAAKASRFIIIVVPPRPRMGFSENFATFVQRLKTRGFETISPQARDGDYFPKDGHWTAPAHARVAKMLNEKLNAAGPGKESR